jgi:murein DD-endopeptidase MepM/ murein hydrolase activator NlpD
MSNNPDAANLGSAYSLLGFRYDPAGTQAFLAALVQIKQAQDELAKSTNKPLTPRPVQPSRAKETQDAIRYAQAEARVARALGDSAGELAALRRAQQAAQGDRIKFLQTTEQVIKKERELQREQSKSSGTPALPRTFAGFTGAGLVQGLGALGVATSIDQLLGSIRALGEESIQLAERAETIGGAYEKAARRAGISADQLLEKLTAASRATVTETELQASANKALALGVGENAQQIADLLAIARQKGKDFGTDTATAFEDIVTGLGRASPLILDNLGITIDQEKANQAYAAALGKTVAQLTDQEKVQALVNAVLKENTDLIQQNAEAELDRADKRAQAQAKIQESKTRIGGALAPFASGVLESTANTIDFITGGAGEKLRARDAALVASASTYAEYQQQIAEVDVQQQTSLSTVTALSEAHFQLAKSLQAAGRSGSEIQAALERVATVEQEIDASILETFTTLDGQRTRLAQLAAVSPGYAQAIAEAIRAYDQPGGAENFARVIAGLSTGLAQQQQAARAAAQATRELDQAQQQAGLSAEDLKKAQTALGDALISASDQIKGAIARRNEQLDELEERHTDRVEELQAQQQEAAKKTQDDISEATAAGVKERTKLEQNGAAQINEATADYGQRREDIIAKGNARLADLEQRYRDEDVRAERAYTSARLNSRASFLSQLNQLTNQRGGGGAKARAEAQAQRAANQAQVDALAQTDPAAAAELQRELDQQLLDNLQRKRENAQRLKDARRGGSLSVAEAQRQIDEENAAETAAQQARIEAIKTGATNRQQQRAQERADVQADTTKQLDELDETYAEQLDKLKTANAERLEEFDERQRERLAQIATHGREQQDALQKQLDKETEQYAAQQERIKDEFDRARQELIDDLNARAAELFLPNETRQKELADASRVLGVTIGSEFIAGLQGAIDTGKLVPGALPADPNQREPQPQRRPPAQSTPGKGPGLSSPQYSGPKTYSRRSTVGQPSKDAILSDQAIDQVVNGGRETDGFSSKRDATGVHAGVDIAAKEGTPVKTPVAGKVKTLPDHPVFGKRIIVQGDDGSEWYFGHLRRALVTAGARVQRGQTVAEVGQTGQVSGPHLHLQYKPGGGRAADPTSVLERLAGGASPAASASAGGSASPQPQSAGTTAPRAIPGDGIDGQRSQFAAQTPSSAPVAVDQSVAVDLRGAQFGSGVSMQEVEQAVKQGVSAGMADARQATSQQIQQLGAQGAIAL